MLSFVPYIPTYLVHFISDQVRAITVVLRLHCPRIVRRNKQNNAKAHTKHPRAGAAGLGVCSSGSSRAGTAFAVGNLSTSAIGRTRQRHTQIGPLHQPRFLLGWTVSGRTCLGVHTLGAHTVCGHLGKVRRLTVRLTKKTWLTQQANLCVPSACQADRRAARTRGCFAVPMYFLCFFNVRYVGSTNKKLL